MTTLWNRRNVFGVALGVALAALTSVVSGPARAADDKPCSAAFTDLDKNGDGMISQDEASDALKGAWSTADANGDGQVSAAEYDACAKM
ncbi:MAG: hypothetical protein R3D33_05155 [Hyphomicrobiaceae bacterium]